MYRGVIFPRILCSLPFSTVHPAPSVILRDAAGDSFALGLLAALPAFLPRSNHRWPCLSDKSLSAPCRRGQGAQRKSSLDLPRPTPGDINGPKGPGMGLGGCQENTYTQTERRRMSRQSTNIPWPGSSQTFPAVPSPPLSMHETHHDTLPKQFSGSSSGLRAVAAQ